MHPSSILVPLSWFISPSDPPAGRRSTADVMCISLGHRLTAGGHQSLHKWRKWPWSASSMAGVVHQNAAEFWTTYAASMYLWLQDSISDHKCHISKWPQAQGLNDTSNVVGFWWVLCVYKAFLTLTFVLCRWVSEHIGCFNVLMELQDSISDHKCHISKWSQAQGLNYESICRNKLRDISLFNVHFLALGYNRF